jgi:hypothetical protein
VTRQLVKVVTTLRIESQLLEQLRRRLREERIRAATENLPNPTLSSVITMILEHDLGIGAGPFSSSYSSDSPSRAKSVSLPRV